MSSKPFSSIPKSSNPNPSPDYGLYFAYLSLLTAAVIPIYTSSFSALKTPVSTKRLIKSNDKKQSRKELDSDSDSEEEIESNQSETLTSSDAYLFPIFGSVVLFSLYLIFKFVDPTLINTLMTIYFAIVGFLAISKVSNETTRWAVGRKKWYQLGGKWKLKLQKNSKTVSHLSFSLLSLPPLLLSFLVIICYILFDRPWPLSNLLALSLAHNAISLISLDSFVTGSILLGGLFLYDIFWVFGTDVMVSVARQFEAPVKIVFPKNFLSVITAYLGRDDSIPKWQLTLLGLGDIVIPGVFVALSLRFDQHLASTSNPSLNFTKSFTSFPKPYFKSTLVAYILGLSITMSVMHFFKKAQPALLYLSPACVFAVVFMAWFRGELIAAWEWKDGGDEEEEEKEKEKKEDGKKAKVGNGKHLEISEKEVNGDGFEDEEEEEAEGRSGATQVRTRKTSSRRRSTRKGTK